MNTGMDQDRRVIAYVFAGVIVGTMGYSVFVGKFDSVLVVLIGGLMTNILLLLGVTRVGKGDDSPSREGTRDEPGLVDRLRPPRNTRPDGNDEGEASRRDRADGLARRPRRRPGVAYQLRV